MELSNDDVIGLPLSPCLSPQGSIFFADRHRILIYEPDCGFSVYAGSEDAGYVEGDAVRARFNSIRGLCFSKTGNELFVADYGNHAIRMINSSGIVSTYAGTGSEKQRSSKIESLETAGFSYPSSVLVSDNGDLYITEAGSHIVSVINTETKTVSKLAGGLPMTSGGHIQSSTFHSPQSLHHGFYGEILVTSKPYADGRSRISAIHPDGYVTMQNFGDSKLFVLDVLPCALSSSYFTIRSPILLEPQFTLYLLDERSLNGESEPSILSTLSPISGLEEHGTEPSDSQMDLDGGQQPATETHDPRDHPELRYRLSAVSTFLEALLPALSGSCRDASEVDVHIALEGASEHEHQWLKVFSVERALPVGSLLETIRDTTPYGANFILLCPNGTIVSEQALLGEIIDFEFQSCPNPQRHPLFLFAPLAGAITLKRSDSLDGPVLKASIEGGITIKKIAQFVANKKNVAVDDVFIYSPLRFPLQNPTAFPMIKGEWHYCLSKVRQFQVVCKPSFFDTEATAHDPITLFSGYCWREAREKIALAIGIPIDIEFKEQLIRYVPPTQKSNHHHGFDTSTKVAELKGDTLKIEKLHSVVPIFFVTMYGAHTTLMVSVDTSFLEMKIRLASWSGLPINQMRIIFAGKLLADHQNCANVSIQSQTTLHVA